MYTMKKNEIILTPENHSKLKNAMALAHPAGPQEFLPVVDYHPLFKSHQVNGEGLEKLHEISNVFSDLLVALTAICPEGRELSVTKTKLEEACFFAKKAVSTQKQNQK
jgi:hypothetical protein